MLGRGLLPGEDHGQATVAVIGESLWRTRFGADPGILGRTIDLGGTPYTVVGVAPASLDYPGRTQLWLPLGFGTGRADDRDSHSYDVIARLKPGSTLAAAQEDMSAVARALAAEYPATNTGRGAKVLSFTEDAIGSIRPALLLLLGAVGFVLLIACANVANLLLARASTRTRELAVRAALGAGRRRLMQQAMAEAVVLSLLGGALGMLVATWSVDALLALHPRGIPRLSGVSVDARVLAFTLLVSVGVGLLFGLAPAFAASRHDPAESFRGEGRGTGGRQGTRFRSGLVVAQIALALVLLAGAALLIVSVRRLAGVDPGLPAGARHRLPVQPAERQVPERGCAAPVRRPGTRRPARDPGRGTRRRGVLPPARQREHQRGRFRRGRAGGRAGPRALRRLSHRDGRISREHGDRAPTRPDAPRDRRPEASACVAVVNEAFVRSFFGGQDPIGKRVTFGSPTDEPEWREIVGVVGDVHHDGLSSPAAAGALRAGVAAHAGVLDHLRPAADLVRGPGERCRRRPSFRPSRPRCTRSMPSRR